MSSRLQIVLRLLVAVIAPVKYDTALLLPSFWSGGATDVVSFDNDLTADDDNSACCCSLSCKYLLR